MHLYDYIFFKNADKHIFNFFNYTRELLLHINLQVKGLGYKQCSLLLGKMLHYHGNKMCLFICVNCTGMTMSFKTSTIMQVPKLIMIMVHKHKNYWTPSHKITSFELKMWALSWMQRGTETHTVPACTS